MDIKEYISNKIITILRKQGIENPQVIITHPKDLTHGDFSTNAAMIYAKKIGLSPTELAKIIVENINKECPNNNIQYSSVAGTGFINFRLTEYVFLNELNRVFEQESELRAKSDGKFGYGYSYINEGKTANIEWVSANPTGPLHTGHGRQIALGKAIANLLEWSGYKVTREYYYNDAGKQMDILGISVYARIIQIYDPSFPFPDDGYVGDYIIEIANKINEEYEHYKEGLSINVKPDFARRGSDFIFIQNDKIRLFFENLERFKVDSIRSNFNFAILNIDSDILNFLKKRAEDYNFNFIERILKLLGVTHDIFYNETLLYKYGKIQKVLREFEEKGLSRKENDAVWLKTSELLKDKKDAQDKVIVKSTGEPTYRLPDMAYHIDKIERGYELIVDIFGADHGDTYKEVLAGVEGLGYDTSKIKVIIHQMVTFLQDGKPVKMSKRSDNVYYLDELIKDVNDNVDVVLFFFVMRSANTHLEFDINLAKEQSEKNPLFYLQYAHARICSILRNANEVFPDYNNTNIENIKFKLLTSEEERTLRAYISRFKDAVRNACQSYEPHKIITYLNEVAESYHKFYHNHRVINKEDPELSFARLKLCEASRIVLRNGFDIIGIGAPERM